MQIINTTDETITLLTRDGKFIEVPGEDSLRVVGTTSWSEWGWCTGYSLKGTVPTPRLGRVVIVDDRVLQFIDSRDDFIIVTKSDGWFRRSWIKNAFLPKVKGKRSKAIVKDVSFHARL